MCNIFGSLPPLLICVDIRKHNRRSEGGGREDGSVGEAGDDKVGLLTSALMEEELEENMSV